MTTPRRGEVWLVDLGMAAKVRPAVVISVPADDTDRALVTLVPHTTSPRQSRFEVSVSVPTRSTASAGYRRISGRLGSTIATTASANEFDDFARAVAHLSEAHCRITPRHTDLRPPRAPG